MCIEAIRMLASAVFRTPSQWPGSCLMARREFGGASVLFIVVAILIGIRAAAAQQVDLNAIQRRFTELYLAGNYGAARLEAQKFEAGVRTRFGVGHRSYAVALDNLGVLLYAEGNYADAERLHKRALTIEEKT